MYTVTAGLFACGHYFDGDMIRLAVFASGQRILYKRVPEYLKRETES